VRWRRVVLACGAALPIERALRFTLIAAFFNQVLPSTVGGDAARIWLLARAGAGWSKATYSVLLDRFVGVLMLAAAVTGGLYWSLGMIEDPIGRAALVVIGLGSLGGGAAFMALARWQWLSGARLLRHLPEMARLARRILFSRAFGPPVVGLSLLIHALTAATAWSMARAVAAPFGFFDAFLLVLPVVLIATVPISIAGWGVRESALVLAFSYAGLPGADGLIIAVLLGLALAAVGIAGGAVWLADPSAMRVQAVLATKPPHDAP
jgi:hypothetical protein